MQQERRCGGEYKENLKCEIRELLKLYRNQSKNHKDSYEEISLDSSLDSYPQVEDEVLKKGNCYIRKVDSLRERLNVIKGNIPKNLSVKHKRVKNKHNKDNAFYSHIYAQYKDRLCVEEEHENYLEKRKVDTQKRNKNEPRDISIFNANVFFKEKYEEPTKELKLDNISNISIDFNKSKNTLKRENTQNVEVLSENKEVLSNNNELMSNKNYANISINPVIDKENANPRNTLSETEIAKLNTIKQNVEEIKNRLNEYSKKRVQKSDPNNEKTMKPINKPHKNFHIHPKTRQPSMPPQNNCTKELKKWNKKKAHKTKRRRWCGYCEVCIELLHRGYSSKDCPTHTQVQ